MFKVSQFFFQVALCFHSTFFMGMPNLKLYPKSAGAGSFPVFLGGPGLQSPEHCSSLSEGFLNQMLGYQGLNSASSLNVLCLIPRWSQRQSLNSKKWKCISGSYRAILGKRMRKSCNTGLFYKAPLDCATFLAFKNKCTRKESQLPSDAHE